MKKITVALLSFFLLSCVSVPKNVEPVSGFELNKYTGKWYEIARLDHGFERGLEKVSATYSINDDGSVRVVNKGLSIKNQQWQEAVGKAKFVRDENTGFLKVSFFGPFYGSYVIFDLDKENYQYAFVTGGKNYLWLLSRTPTISEELKNKFLRVSKEAGYNVDELIFVNQE